VTPTRGAAPAAARAADARTVLRSTLVVALVDGLFAVVVYVVVLQVASVQGVFQGIASTVLGRSAFQGGWTTAILGMVMHVGVALAWSSLFLTLVRLSSPLRRLLDSSAGSLAVAAVLGPLIYVAMTMTVIPLLTGRGPTVDGVWWSVLLGHIPFVAIPIVWIVRRDLRRSPSPNAPT
jgi:hypothetical protein